MGNGNVRQTFAATTPSMAVFGSPRMSTRLCVT